MMVNVIAPERRIDEGKSRRREPAGFSLEMAEDICDPVGAGVTAAQAPNGDEDSPCVK